MVARSSDSPGRARISRRAIAQGRPECFRFTCMLVCAFLCASMHTRPRVQRAPGLPCALLFLGARTRLQTPGTCCRENAKSHLFVVPASSRDPYSACGLILRLTTTRGVVGPGS